jgi:dipeptidyl aminopeptidase/acylaminoacyl peptidase
VSRRVPIFACAALLAVVALLAVACSGGSEDTGEGTPSPGSRNATGLPTSVPLPSDQSPPVAGEFIVYRNTLQADAVAVSMDHSEVWALDFDSAIESIRGVDCTRDGSGAVYVMQDNVSMDTWLAVVVDGQRKEFRPGGEVVGAALSPDASQVALTAYIPDAASGRLSLLDVETGEVTDAVTRPGTIGYPRWAPDGKQIVYDATFERGNQLFVYTLGETEPRQLTNIAQNAFGPDWSPEGDVVVFSSFTAEGNPQLFTVPAAGGEATQLTSTQTFKANPRWSADGSLIAYVGTILVPTVSRLPSRLHNVAVFTSGPDGSNETPFTDIALDAWLLGWCTAGPWLQEGWVRQ